MIVIHETISNNGVYILKFYFHVQITFYSGSQLG